MASFVFMATQPNQLIIGNLSQSGIAFFGGNFAQSVAVGAWQSSSQISNSNGTVNGPTINNVQYLNPASGVVNGASSGIPVLNIPNYLATFMAEFQHSSPVTLQNSKAYIYDRSNINNPPSGVVAKLIEIIHPSLLITDVGSGSPVWNTPAGSSYLALSVNPTTSGLYSGNPDTLQRFHFGISESPSSIGSKTLNGFYIETEYL